MILSVTTQQFDRRKEDLFTTTSLGSFRKACSFLVLTLSGGHFLSKARCVLDHKSPLPSIKKIELTGSIIWGDPIWGEPDDADRYM